MASYSELHGIRNDAALRKKIHVALADVAYDILNTTPVDTAERIAWAKATVADPAALTDEYVNYVLIANQGLSASTILAASDASIKTNISNAVTVIVGAAA